MVADVMSELGQNEKPALAASCQLPPAADIPSKIRATFFKFARERPWR
jgi:hypothetical protein